MRRWVVMAGVVTILTGAGARDARAAATDVQELAWLEGTWAGEKDGVQMEEHWTSAKGGVLLGLHRDVKGDRVVSWEFLRIQATPEGIVYFASPRSKPPVPFRLVSRSDKRVVFENLQHDFPQRILYWIDDAGALHARIEGPQGGGTAAEEWVWRKRACVAPRVRAAGRPRRL